MTLHSRQLHESLGAIGSTKQGVGSATARRIRERGGDVSLARDIPELKP